MHLWLGPGAVHDGLLAPRGAYPFSYPSAYHKWPYADQPIVM